MGHHGQQFFIPLSSLLLDAEEEEEEVEEGEGTGEGEGDSLDPDGTAGSSGTTTSGDRRLCVTREASIRGVRNRVSSQSCCALVVVERR